MKAIVCMTTDRSIGRGNELIYKISDDLRRFKKFTEGNVVVMGRNTFESLPHGPLKNRVNIIMSTTIEPGTYSWSPEEGLYRNLHGIVKVVSSVDELRNFCGTFEDVWCIGGGKLYKLLLPYISRIEITEVQEPGKISDVKFPELDLEVWDIYDVSEVLSEGSVKYKYKVAERKAWTLK